MRLLRVAPMAVALTLVAAACGDSTGPQVELSNAELLELFDQIGDVLDTAGVGGLAFQAVGMDGAATAATPRPALPSAFFGVESMPPVSFTVEVGCAGGGTAAVSGSGNAAADSSSFDFSVTESFTGCQTEDFTINGSFTVSGNGTSSGGDASFAVDVDGTLTVVTADGREGACRLDYGLTLSRTSTSLSFEVHGTICGRNVQDVINQQNAV